MEKLSLRTCYMYFRFSGSYTQNVNTPDKTTEELQLHDLSFINSIFLQGQMSLGFELHAVVRFTPIASLLLNVLSKMNLQQSKLPVYATSITGYNP